METEQQHLDGDTPAAVEQTVGHTKMSRRDALSIISKHAVYTAPAVLAVLAVTKSKSAHADTSF